MKKKIGLLMVIALSALMIRVFIFGDDIPEQGYAWSDLALADQVLTIAGLLSGFALWIWMLVDFFRVRPQRFPILWGFVLFLFSWGGGVLYFLVEYLPRSPRRAESSLGR